MSSQTSYAHARSHLAALCDKAVSTREPIIIRRPGADDVALVSAAELRSLSETAHLLRSPKNAQRLITALLRAHARKLPPTSLDELRREFKLGKG